MTFVRTPHFGLSSMRCVLKLALTLLPLIRVFGLSFLALVTSTTNSTGVQIVDICLATRAHNGGLIKLEELCKLLCQRRKGAREAVSEDDCLRAISKLKVLGSGFEVITVGKRKLVRSVPTELNKDHNEILEMAQAQGFVTVEEVERRLSWSSGRAIDALETLLDEGLAMIDDGHRDGQRRYWFPCVSSISSYVGAETI
ncbi:hypothetical protein AgCh_016087 [Apium graveolens]